MTFLHIKRKKLLRIEIVRRKNKSQIVPFNALAFFFNFAGHCPAQESPMFLVLCT